MWVINCSGFYLKKVNNVDLRISNMDQIKNGNANLLNSLVVLKIG